MAKAKKKTKKGVIGKTTGVGVCATWLIAFERKSIKTVAQGSAFMKSEFPERNSKIFDYPNVVIGRANRGLLDGKKHSFKLYSKQLDKAVKQS